MNNYLYTKTNFSLIYFIQFLSEKLKLFMLTILKKFSFGGIRTLWNKD